ncbi:hypothetical protein [Azonexus sp. IMCC34839]|uniref:hypothetical protein n=1 Tax=Azonexus sp. IMCC34839 TaxID=3133695 RepID=UPI00399B50E0
MAEQKKTSVKPAAAAKPPKQLVPRTAPKAEAGKPAAAAKPTPAPAAKPVIKPVAASARNVAPAAAAKPAATVKQPTKVVSAKKPAKAVKPAKVEKAEKAPKARKVKLVRDSYAMPEAEYARIGELKKRLLVLGREVKKSELLRGGIAVLAALNDAELQAVMARVERIKTGRPAK